MADYIYSMQGLSKVVPPDKKIVEGVYLSFTPGAKIGVLGVNGAGKSTILRIMAGIDNAYNGEAFLKPGATRGYLAQEPDLSQFKIVREAVEAAVSETRGLLKKFEELSMKLGEPLSEDEMTKVLDEQSKLQDKIDAADAWNLDNQLELAMDALRLPPADAEIARLSGGEKRRVALCKILLEKPDLLLLDEPTNHLDAESVAWLEQHLAQYKGTVVAVTHDRYFLDNVAEWILELDRGRAIPFKGNYTAWLEAKEKRLQQEEKQEGARQRKIAAELEWVRASPRARQAKSKARLTAYDSLLAEQTRVKRDLNEVYLPPGPRLGDIVIEAENVRKSFGDTLLFENVNFRIPKNAIVGIIGPNGAGKTTLFRMITGQEKPDSGTLRVGETVRLGYIDQSRDNLNGENTVFKEVSDNADFVTLGKQDVPARQYTSWFNFKGQDQQKLVKHLSGGERNRVHLAKMVKTQGNVLLLDEPTNDLDVETLRSLEGSLLDFAGCAIIISHDRWFLDRIATHILAFEGDSHVEWFEGNFDAYEEDRKRRFGAASSVPTRIKYRKLTR